MAVIDHSVAALALPFSLREEMPEGRMRAGEASVVNNVEQQSALDNRLQFADMAPLPLTPAPLPQGEGLNSRSAA